MRICTICLTDEQREELKRADVVRYSCSTVEGYDRVTGQWSGLELWPYVFNFWNTKGENVGMISVSEEIQWFEKPREWHESFLERETFWMLRDTTTTLAGSFETPVCGSERGVKP